MKIELDTIYNMNCLEGMKAIPDGSVDCIICDLPYGTTRNQWDSIIPLDLLWEQYKRIIKPNGVIALFAQCPFDKVLGCSNLEMLKYEWIWEKPNPTGHLNAKFAPLKKHENILIFSKAAASFVKDPTSASVYNPQYREGKPYKCKQGGPSSNYDPKWQNGGVTDNDGKHYYPTTIVQFNRDKEKIHPTQKPVDLIAYLVRTYSNEGDTILDNCMGSGTTAIACIREHRHFIGFELNEEYYAKAMKRIEAERQQPTLF